MNVNNVVRVFKQLAITSLTLRKRDIGPPPLRDVPPHHKAGEDIVIFVADGDDVDLVTGIVAVDVHYDLFTGEGPSIQVLPFVQILAVVNLTQRLALKSAGIVFLMF